MFSVLQVEVPVAEAARGANVSEQGGEDRKRQVVEAGKTSLVAGKTGPSPREQQLEHEVAELIQAPRGAAALRAPRGDPLGRGS